MADSGANIHLENESTKRISPVITSINVTSRIPYGSKMELSHIVTLQIQGLTKKYNQIFISPETRTDPFMFSGSYVMMDATSHYINKK